jgi:hypothetical protein
VRRLRTWSPRPTSRQGSTSLPAARRGNAGTGHGNPYRARILGEVAGGAAHIDTLLGSGIGGSPAAAVEGEPSWRSGRSILVNIWALPSDKQTRFVDLDPDCYASRTNPKPPAASTRRKVHQHVREL